MMSTNKEHCSIILKNIKKKKKLESREKNSFCIPLSCWKGVGVRSTE